MTKYYDCIIGNPEAVKKEVRYIDEDLNRVSNKNLNLQSYESKRSKELIKIISDYEYVIDLHETKSSDNIMLIVSNWSIEKKKAMTFCPVDKIIFWPSSSTNINSVTDSCPNGFELEIGTKTTYKEKIEQVSIILQETIKNINKNTTPNNIKEYFGVYEKITELDLTKDGVLEDFKEYHSTSSESFYPLCFGKYMGNVGYKMKRIDKYINSNILDGINIYSDLKSLITRNS